MEFKYSFLIDLVNRLASLIESSNNAPRIGPGNGVVCNSHWRCPVPNLAVEPPPGVKDGIMEGSSERALLVEREAVAGDAFPLRATCRIEALVEHSTGYLYHRACHKNEESRSKSGEFAMSPCPSLLVIPQDYPPTKIC